MKWLLAPILWLLALCLAFLVLWRLWRGRPILLRGRWSPRVLRLVAVVLVILGVGVDQAPAQRGKPIKPGAAADPSPEPPLPVSVPLVEKWIPLTAQTSSWTRFKQGFTQVQIEGKLTERRLAALRTIARRAPEGLNKLLLSDLDAAESGKPAAVVPVRDLLRALEEAEKAGYYDLWLTAYLWRQGGRSQGDALSRIELFRKLGEHARLTNALIKARPRGGMLLPPRAWMSKVGPRPGQLAAHKDSLKAVAKAANTLFVDADLGTWQRDGLAVFTSDKASAPATLLLPEKKQPIAEGADVRWHRLALLQTPAGDKSVVLVHRAYGKVVIPGGKLVSVHDLPGYLSEAARRLIDRDVTDALKGSEAAAARLEKALPLVHRRLREQLLAQPNAKGSSRLRLILSLFDDAVMPLPETATPATTRALPGR
jgi:hypothetical protein